MAGRLSGRTAVVTGGSAGIGQEIARRLASEGADIAVADLDPAQETRELVMATGRRFLGDEVDVSDEGAVQEFAARVRTELGGAAILVNNAAVVLLADIDLGRDRLVAELIVNITSSSHWTPPPPFVSYVAAKGALNGLTSVLSANLAAHDITVNAVAAGLVRTASASSCPPTSRAPWRSSPPTTPCSSRASWSPRTAAVRAGRAGRASGATGEGRPQDGFVTCATWPGRAAGGLGTGRAEPDVEAGQPASAGAPPPIDERIVRLVVGRPRPLAPAAVDVLAREGYDALGRGGRGTGRAAWAWPALRRTARGGTPPHGGARRPGGADGRTGRGARPGRDRRTP
ncbi:SDR family NAD(P)-dependent oxidoreductase [Streptomyces sp. MNU76]|uniref:SDR family NAD(P)-dependent oxidoreductase n=1 Tax=Streptomyces sp. MNU76 TaxID=2560026 RepID=UPI001E354E3D|nr:SDR family NAD(P)-dependent oxidoreductase [Streptomyces sp. MNU76]MCC9708419.1 SDR family NAD(P)-dependent oxidoreductase [Streptomyces sp. MNU76]